MLILGINDTHDASACLIKDGKLVQHFKKKECKNKKHWWISW